MSKRKTKKKALKLAAVPRLKIMVASTIYGFETELVQICGVLKGYGYDVLNSHLGTIPVNPAKDNLGNCIAAVDSCDLILGIIRTVYGSGVLGARSITHEEMLRAVALQKPRWFLVHAHVPLVRQILKQYRFDGHGKAVPGFAFKRTDAFEDVRIIDMYDEVTAAPAGAPTKEHRWAQSYATRADILTFVKAQFRDVKRIRQICEEMRHR
jgi:hypothetical protein